MIKSILPMLAILAVSCSGGNEENSGVKSSASPTSCSVNNFKFDQEVTANYDTCVQGIGFVTTSTLDASSTQLSVALDCFVDGRSLGTESLSLQGNGNGSWSGQSERANSEVLFEYRNGTGKVTIDNLPLTTLCT